MSNKRKDNKNRVLKEGEYQKSSGTYEYKWRDKRGNRHSVGASTLEELREKEKDIQKDQLDGLQIKPNTLTIDNLYDMWVKLKRGLKDNTFCSYKFFYTHYVQGGFGQSKLVDLKRSDIRNFYNTLIDVRHLKFNSIDSIHTVLHQVLELAVEDDYLRYNPSDNALKELKKVRNVDTEKRRALTIPEMELFEDYLDKSTIHQHWKPIFTVMLWTGMRVGEVTGLRWEDIDLEKGLISVNHTLVYYNHANNKCYFGINTPKSKAGFRTIPMLPKVKKAFIEEKAFQELTGIKCNISVDGYTNFIFVNRFGNCQHQGTLNRALKCIAKNCNSIIMDKNPNKEVLVLPNFSCHSLRHTFTTRMCEANVNLKAMQEILGHKDAETTMDIYAEASDELKTAELISFEEYFNKKKAEQNNRDISFII